MKYRWEGQPQGGRGSSRVGGAAAGWEGQPQDERGSCRVGGAATGWEK